MRGASASAVHLVRVIDRRGRRSHAVLRRYVHPASTPAGHVIARRESAVLALLERSEVPAPRLLAADIRGERTDAPAVLMERLPGRCDLEPRDLDPWLRRIAEMLPAIHAVRDGREILTRYRPYNRGVSPDVPPWTGDPAAWARAIERYERRAPRSRPTLIHRDYHPMNLLWSRGRITAVLDWEDASWGPPEADVGHCRNNLAGLFGTEIADRFLSYCTFLTGGYDPYWDIVSAVDMLPARPRRPARFDAFVAAAVARL